MRFGSRRVSQTLAWLSLLALLGAIPALALAQEDEPIAYIGHGAFFERGGQQVAPTAEFVAKAQDWYLARLLNALDAKGRSDFARFSRQLGEAVPAQGQAALVVRHRLLEWLMERIGEREDNARTFGKLRALRFALRWKLPESPDPKRMQDGSAPFALGPELEKKLRAFAPEERVAARSATLNKGQDYINECRAAGVPIPPAIGVLDPAGLAGWKTQGFIPQTEQFIVGTPAEVRTFESFAPRGMCIALPRYTDNNKTDVALDGVICLGQQSSKVCFWDNQMNGSTFQFPAGTQIPIGVPNPAIDPSRRYQAGGAELNGAAGGVCTECHAGENPYIIHPLSDLGGGLRMGALGQAPLNLPTFGADRYDPLVLASWNQNRFSHSPALVPSVCSGCHQRGGIAGRFPHLSTELGAYCGTILSQAINKTMPPGAGGSEAANPDVIAFQAFCNSSATTGPTDRGDPHLTTTNGIHYDFQSAGEFTALRNSDTGFELQTRQTPVATLATPLADPYTGLASCVSLNTAAAFRLGTHRVTYQPLGGLLTAVEPQLRIDGKLTKLPLVGSIKVGTGNRISRNAAGDGLDVRAADGTRVILSPNFWLSEGYWYLNVEVLDTPAREGTMGHVRAGDWLPLAPDGSSFGPRPPAIVDRHLELNRDFANAWRVTNASSLFDYLPGTSTATFTDRNWPPAPGNTCRTALNPRLPVKPAPIEVAQALCRVIQDATANADCVFDVTTTGDLTIPKAYLKTLKLRKAAN